MDSLHEGRSEQVMRMATKEHYRKQADKYRTSSQYIRMINEYPVLESSIKLCKNEKSIE